MRGFTLIETLVYLAIYSLMLTGLFSAIALLHDQARASRASAESLLRSLNERDAQDHEVTTI